MQKPVLQPAKILLPQDTADIGRWAVLACDQFTSQPEYWQAVENFVENAPSTLHMVLPEVYLEDRDVAQRIQHIHAAMQRYVQEVLTKSRQGYVYVERTLPSGHVRQGLVGMVDLEDYSYAPGAACRIRPSENTVVDRIPPRLAVRRSAKLESPHILMLADDAACSIIEPLSTKKQTMELLYDQKLMLDGGHICGWAVTDAADIDALAAAMQKLDDPTRFAALYGTEEKTAPFALAVGDGNHSLATAKALWEELKPTLTEAEQQSHPARHCLVELENIQSPAIEIEPIHRVLFGTDDACVLRGVALYAASTGLQITPAGQGKQQFTGVYLEKEESLGIANPSQPLAVGSLEDFLAEYQKDHPHVRIDYVHGEQSVRELAQKGAVGILLPPFEKSDLFRGVAMGGVLPKKTFSMGHANEKRYYLECRAIQE